MFISFFMYYLFFLHDVFFVLGLLYGQMAIILGGNVQSFFLSTTLD